MPSGRVNALRTLDLTSALSNDALLALDVVVALLLLIVLAAIVLLARRWLLGAMRGAFDCFVAFPGQHDGRWRSGVARYESTRLAFYASRGARWWPSLVFDRARLSLLERLPMAGEPAAIPGGLILRCEYQGDRLVDLGMDEPAASAFAVWVDSGPPGQAPPGQTRSLS